MKQCIEQLAILAKQLQSSRQNSPTLNLLENSDQETKFVNYSILLLCF